MHTHITNSNAWSNWILLHSKNSCELLHLSFFSKNNLVNFRETFKCLKASTLSGAFHYAASNSIRSAKISFVTWLIFQLIIILFGHSNLPKHPDSVLNPHPFLWTVKFMTWEVNALGTEHYMLLTARLTYLGKYTHSSWTAPSLYFPNKQDQNWVWQHITNTINITTLTKEPVTKAISCWIPATIFKSIIQCSHINKNPYTKLKSFYMQGCKNSKHSIIASSYYSYAIICSTAYTLLSPR